MGPCWPLPEGWGEEKYTQDWSDSGMGKTRKAQPPAHFSRRGCCILPATPKPSKAEKLGGFRGQEGEVLQPPASPSTPQLTHRPCPRCHRLSHLPLFLLCGLLLPRLPPAAPGDRPAPVCSLGTKCDHRSSLPTWCPGGRRKPGGNWATLTAPLHLSIPVST